MLNSFLQAWNHHKDSGDILTAIQSQFLQQDRVPVGWKRFATKYIVKQIAWGARRWDLLCAMPRVVRIGAKCSKCYFFQAPSHTGNTITVEISKGRSNQDLCS